MQPISEPVSMHGQVAIVTGAGAEGDGIGNGRAVALLLARQGVNVLAVDLDAARAQTTADMGQGAAGRIVPLAADVATEPGARQAVEAAMDSFGRLDLLDNNVGVGSTRALADEDFAAWQRVMDINVNSAFLMTRAATPHMRVAGGRIVNVASLSAIQPRAGYAAYATSKGAIVAMTRSLAVELGADGIAVNCVAPGPVLTPMAGGALMAAEARESRRRASLLNIEGTGWDVAHAVAFLLSPAARYITGQVLLVDGGASLKSVNRQP